MFTWLWSIIFPSSLQNLYLGVAGVHLFHLAASRLHDNGIDLAAALSYGWGNDKLLHDSIQIVQGAWTIYLLAIFTHPLWPNIVIVVAWVAFLALLFMPIDQFGGQLRIKLLSYHALSLSKGSV